MTAALNRFGHFSRDRRSWSHTERVSWAGLGGVRGFRLIRGMKKFSSVISDTHMVLSQHSSYFSHLALAHSTAGLPCRGSDTGYFFAAAWCFDFCRHFSTIFWLFTQTINRENNIDKLMMRIVGCSSRTGPLRCQTASHGRNAEPWWTWSLAPYGAAAK